MCYCLYWEHQISTRYQSHGRSSRGTNCGKELDDGVEFCGGCGSKVETISSDDNQQNEGGSNYIAKWQKMEIGPRILVGYGGCIALIMYSF